LANHALVKQVARVAAVFHLDPVALLRDSDELVGLVRIAAAMVVQRDEAKRTEEERKSMKRR
jgi:predicted SPOUT superfamily RNA methylase MTH1